jgi:hypothetical protein
MSTIIYPKFVTELGAKHRRQYKYTELPALWQSLYDAENMLLAYLEFKERVKAYNFDLTTFEENVKINYVNAWTAYYGVDAYEHLIRYYWKDCVQWVELREHLTRLLA